jgi:hypothetical protein
LKRLWRVALILLLLVLAVLLLVFFSASSWLETSAGRTLLQRELGKSLGLQAALQGEYALELFPGLQIAGQQLELREVDSSQAMARLESYQLHLALWPLLSKQVVIHKVVVRDGFLDLDLLEGNAANPPDEVKTESQLPSIRSLQVSGLKLLKSSTDLLNIDHLALENFTPGKDAAISLGFSLPGDPAGSSLVQLSGKMQLATAPLHLTLKLAETSLRVKDQAWPLGQGQLDWSADSGVIEGSLTGQIAGFSGLFEFSLQTVPVMNILLASRLVTADGRNLSVSVAAREQAGFWVLEPVELMLEGQLLSGTGCFSMQGKPLLQLQLQSPDLDLDKLQDLLPADLLSASSGSPNASADLPVDLAVELLAEQASMAGAEAREVRLLLGNQPDCSL